MQEIAGQPSWRPGGGAVGEAMDLSKAAVPDLCLKTIEG